MKRRILRSNAADILGQNIKILPLLSFVKSKSWNLSKILVLQYCLLTVGCENERIPIFTLHNVILRHNFI